MCEGVRSDCVEYLFLKFFVVFSSHHTGGLVVHEL